jgi:hypothetical protein
MSVSKTDKGGKDGKDDKGKQEKIGKQFTHLSSHLDDGRYLQKTSQIPAKTQPSQQ